MPAPIRQAQLSWSIPTTRANGTPLTPSELSGYEIYMLSESSGESTVFTVHDSLVSSYTVSNLNPGIYHFSMSAQDTTGKLSALSTVVSKTLQ